MRLLITSVLILISIQSYASCYSRYDVLDPDDEKPLFMLLSCKSALEYVRENEDRLRSDWGLDETTVSRIAPTDKAIEVQPQNKSAIAFMFQNKTETWHYVGSCDAVPLQKLVTLTIKQHCSDTGLTVYAILGDMTINAIAVQD